MTQLETVYSAFFNLITDDMYMELTPEETQEDVRNILNIAIPLFEFPKKVLTITKENNVEQFTVDLSSEEVLILATCMQHVWLQRQITSIENIRQKFSGADFKLTSQASHLKQLLSLIKDVRTENIRLQRLYSRREADSSGVYQTTFGKLTSRKR